MKCLLPFGCIIFTILALNKSLANPVVKDGKQGSAVDPEVYLAINAIARSKNGKIVQLRRLEINWIIEDDQRSKYTPCLYDKNPEVDLTNSLEPVLCLNLENVKGDHYVTEIQLPISNQ